jgi:isoaspartyl peptidase/L-asparaginase-like protein (Ntn-hydrolase superfamily)
LKENIFLFFKAMASLKKGSSALDAVVIAVRYLEVGGFS